MKKNNLIFGFILFSSFLYLYLFSYLISNLELWIFDLQSCYKVMSLSWFLTEHINIFFYLALFLVMSFFLVRTLFIFGIKLKKLVDINKNINLLKVKKIRNLVIIDYPSVVAFNFLNKIILSKEIFNKLNKKERKTIFLHEKGHLKSLDSLKMLIADILLSLFPNWIKQKVLDAFILSSEKNADKFAINFVGKKTLANTLINVVSLNTVYPLMNNFTQERLKLLIEEKDVKIPKYIWIVYIFFVVVFFLLIYYKTCLCGAM